MIGALFGALALLIWLVLWLGRAFFWRLDLDRQEMHIGDWPGVVVIIPARNEASGIGDTLRSLWDQGYPGSLRIVVVDDHSEDATSEIAWTTAAELEKSEELQVLSADPIPVGWTGKVWAMHQGVSRGISVEDSVQFILFSDADIVHGKDSLRELTSRAMQHGYDLVSYMVKLRCENVAERFTIPAFVFFFKLIYPFRKINNPMDPLGGAAGGTMLVRRTALERIGGLKTIKNALIDDCALGRAIKSGGHSVWLGLTESSRSSRGYDSLAEVVRMIARTAYTQLGYCPGQLLVCVVGLGVTFLAPPILALMGEGWGRLAGGAAWMILTLLYVPLVRFYRISPLWALLLPATAVVYLFATLLSAWHYHSGSGGRWKGRSQSLPPATRTSKEPKNSYRIVAVITLAIALRVFVALTTRFTNEDFLITLRYAENIAAGNGFVYNPGERVLGTTTPLYALTLALAGVIGLTPVIVAKLLNIAADGVTCLILYLWLREMGQEPAGYAAAFLTAINPIHVRWSVAGMESGLVACGIALVGWLWWRRREYAVYSLLGILFLLRWDTLLLTSILTLGSVMRDRRVPLLGLVVFGLVVTPWLVFATYYFGTPIPVTAGAKLAVYSWQGGTDLFPGTRGLISRLLGDPIQLFAVGIAGLGVWVLRKSFWDLAPFVCWLLVYGGILSVTRVLLFEWYLVPPLPLVELYLAVALVWMSGQLFGNTPRPTIKGIKVGIATLVAIFAGWRGWELCSRNQKVEEELRKPLGEWLRTVSVPTDRVMLEPIGYIGYYSRLRVLDVIGLVSPQVTPYWRSNSVSPLADLALRYQPEWMVLRPREAAHIKGSSAAGRDLLDHQYQVVRTWDYDPPGPDQFSLIVYRRSTTPEAIPAPF